MTSSKKNVSTDSAQQNKTSANADPKNDQDALTDSVADTAISDTEMTNMTQEALENEDLACAENPEANVKIESISEDVVVATLETTEPMSQSNSEQPNPNKPNSEQSNPKQQNHEDSSESQSDFFQSDAADTSEMSAQDKKNADITESTDDDLTVDAQHAPLDSSDEQADSQAKTNNTLKDKSVHEHDSLQSDDQHNDQNNDQDEEQDNSLNIDEHKEHESDEEEVQEEKEAKLESYKQFVAEQFNNKKVDYPEVRVRIEANALPSRMYFIMNILSAIIASYGLVTNSAAVVIGAMLVAMMLGPITGVALAIIDYRMPLLRKSLVTVFLGVSLVLVVGFIVGWLHKDQPLTAEILSRTQPTSMDLMIALAGGTAGAYAMVSPHLSVAVVGVAVATALVPPLAASGILFANGELQLGFGALLLAVTNIIAIQFTNALVLWVLGFRRLVDNDYKSNNYLTFLQRNAVTLLLLGGLGTYLTINLQTNAKQQVFESSVKEAINSYFIDQGNVLTNTQFDTSDENQVVRAVVRGETTPTSTDVRKIEAVITQDMVENFPEYLPIKLQLRYLPVQVIESDPVIKDKLDETDAAILTN